MNSFGKLFKTTFVLTVVAGVLVLYAAPLAQAGGGCHEPTTNSTRTSVGIGGVCFSPTILHVKVGDTVTWRNDKSTASHTITGANLMWGTYLDQIAPGASFSHQFTTDGVYPYYCMLHPGMAGAVVVGNGQASGVNSDSFTLAGGAQRSQSMDAASTGSGGASDHLWLFVPLSVGVAVATAAGGFVVGIRRARG